MNTQTASYLQLKDASNGNYAFSLDGYYKKSFENGEMDTYHKHSRYELMFVEDGECEILIMDGPESTAKTERVSVSSGSGILLDAGCWHKLIVKDKCSIANVEFLPIKQETESNSIKELSKNSKEVASFLAKFNRYAIFTDNGKISWLLDCIIDYTSSSKDYRDFKTALCMYANLLFTEIAHSCNLNGTFVSYEIHVKKAIQYINSHIKEKIRSEDISDYVGVSYGYLEGLFKKRLGFSLGDYIINEKCKIAEKLLTNSSQRISDIARSVNFGSRQQFCSVFTQYSGVSPMKYRIEKHNKHEYVSYGFTGSYNIEYFKKGKKITKNTI